LLIRVNVNLEQVFNIPPKLLEKLYMRVGTLTMPSRTLTYILDIDDQQPYATLIVRLEIHQADGINIVDINPKMGDRMLVFILKPVIENGKTKKLEVFLKQEEELIKLGELEMPVLREKGAAVPIQLSKTIFAGNVSPSEPGAYTASVSISINAVISSIK